MSHKNIILSKNERRLMTLIIKSQV